MLRSCLVGRFAVCNRLVGNSIPRLARFESTAPSGPSGPAGSAKPSGPTETKPVSNQAGNAADYLVGLSGSAKSTEEADAAAQQWLDAFQSLRQDLKPNGEPFVPSKALRPEGAPDDWTLFDLVLPEKPVKYSPKQIAQARKAYSSPLPEKLDEDMDYLANCIMRHGRKARAHRFLNRALYLVYLRTRKDPVEQLKTVLEDMAPLVRLKRYSDGGARAELVPVPLTRRQRLRQAWDWILESSNRRESRDLSVRLAEEIIAATKGTSSGFDKKVTQHKLAISNRAFVSLLTKNRR